MQWSSQSCRVHVFAAPGLEGTTAKVYCLDDMLEPEEMQRLASMEEEPATCFITPQESHVFNIRCFNTTQEIRLCGHGLLASAKVVFEQTGSSSITFQTSTDSVKARYDTKNDSIEIAFAPLHSASVSPPKWLKECFSTLPLQVAQAGPTDGYWVMQWPQGTLQNLQVDAEKLSMNTQRALIATEAATDDIYDYYFRYFAPQHGVIEDKATGSAQRVLISYWSEILNQCNVKARQYSKEGAELLGRVEDQDVWISGNVDIER